MNWLGANSYRTAHYPYAEDMLDYADRHGIVVIDETAAVGINLMLGARLTGDQTLPAPHELFTEQTISSRTQEVHRQAIRELIARDKNHPSVVMWSIANEPDLKPAGSREYFAPLLAEAKRLDPSRPVILPSQWLRVSVSFGSGVTIGIGEAHRLPPVGLVGFIAPPYLLMMSCKSCGTDELPCITMWQLGSRR